MSGLDLDAGQANYLGNVMRLGEGAEVLLFDGSSGEWLARDCRGGQEAHDARASSGGPASPRAIPDVWLAFAPVKRAQTDWLVEKATELGVARLVPVMTQRTIVERVKLERLEAIAIEAAEQCGRTRLPAIEEPVLAGAIAEARGPGARSISPTKAAASRLRSAFKPGPATILTGPEGGFTDEERAAIRAAAECRPDLARPAHPARRDRRARRAGGLHGGGGRLARRTYRAINRKCWRASGARLSAAAE